MNIPATALTVALITCPLQAQRPPAPIVDTGQNHSYDAFGSIRSPQEGHAYYGQDGQHQGFAANYIDNQDGTITDQVTGLTWSQSVDPEKVSLEEAQAIAKTMTLGGHNDWRVPKIKELYSLIDFRGATGLAMGQKMDEIPSTSIPYINTDYFDFRYGDIKNGERFIDAQWLSSTRSVSPVMDYQQGLFGVNFADGRIKCYPFEHMHRKTKKFYVRYVRGRSDYGKNQFIDNKDGTVTDHATGLTWMQHDSAKGMNWKEALKHAEDMQLGGHSDWRLPNAKELQSIVDYTRSPDATDSPAIDPIFATSTIYNEAGHPDYPFFWTSTTHLDGPNARQAVYIAFGRGIGQMHNHILDAHGAGCQRSDPKEGKPALGNGPQGDAQRIDNYLRCVRGGSISVNANTTTDSPKYPHTIQLANGSSYQPEALSFEESTTGIMEPHRSIHGNHHPPHQGNHPHPKFKHP